MTQSILENLVAQAQEILIAEHAARHRATPTGEMTEDARDDWDLRTDLSFGQRIAFVRLQYRWTQEELAHRAGIGLPTLVAIEQGDVSNPPLHTAVALSKAIGKSLDATSGLVAERFHQGFHLAACAWDLVPERFLWRTESESVPAV
jgi:transcriptional regulator with XRE-family HTH domain